MAVNREQLIQQAYEVSRKRYEYNDRRRLLDAPHGVGAGYNSLLPTWKQQNFMQHVDGLMPREPSLLVRVVDFGSGPYGFFLIDCYERWGNRFDGIGINSRVAEPQEITHTYPGVRLIEGDVHNANRLIKGASADVVTSLRNIPYLVDPWKVVMIIDHLLKPGGIALLDQVPLDALIPEMERDSSLRKLFVDFLQRRGIEVILYETAWRGKLSFECSLAWQKNSEALKVPLVYGSEPIEHQLQIVDTSQALDPSAYDYFFTSVSYNIKRDVLHT